MARKKNHSCLGVLALIGVSCFIGYAAGGSTGAFIGGVIGVILAVAILGKDTAKKCEICGNPIKRDSYEAEVNGKKFKTICPPCKNHLMSKNRKQKMAELLTD